MTQGFVYVLINPSIDGQVKIGLTTVTSEKRAVQLSSSSGVPTPFIVVYDELVSDCEEVERRLHTRFAGYRVNRNREFFRIPIKEAVKALQQEAAAFRVLSDTPTDRVEIFEELRDKYSSWLKPDIISAAIVQLPHVCFLEIIRKVYSDLHDEIIERTDLSFIYIGGDQPMFPLNRTVQENARTFIEQMDSIDIINCTSLFTEEAVSLISDEAKVFHQF
jgi:hypothetical protein